MNVRKTAESDLAVTLEWDPVPNATGFIYTLDGDQHLIDGKRHFTFDGSTTTVKIGKPQDDKPHTFEVVALGSLDSGTVTIGDHAPPPPAHGARTLPQGPFTEQTTPLSNRDWQHPSTLAKRKIAAPGPRGNAYLLMGANQGSSGWVPPPPSPGPFTLSDVVFTLAGAPVAASDPTSGTDQSGAWIGAQVDVDRMVAAGPWSGMETVCQCRDSNFYDVTIGWPQPDGTIKPVASTGLYIEHFSRRLLFDGLTVFATHNAVNGEWTYKDSGYAPYTIKEYPAFPAGKSGSLDIEIRNFHLHSEQGWGAFLDAGCCGYWLHDGLITGNNGVAHPKNLAVPSKPNRVDWSTIDFRGSGQRELIHANAIG